MDIVHRRQRLDYQWWQSVIEAGQPQGKLSSQKVLLSLKIIDIFQSCVFERKNNILRRILFFLCWLHDLKRLRICFLLAQRESFCSLLKVFFPEFKREGQQQQEQQQQSNNNSFSNNNNNGSSNNSCSSNNNKNNNNSSARATATKATTATATVATAAKATTTPAEKQQQ